MRKRRRQLAAAAGGAILLLIGLPAAGVRAQRAAPGSAGAVAVPAGTGAAARAAYYQTQLRLQEDLAAFRQFRPAYPFWRHIYTVPDGSIIYGSAADGRLLATFPQGGNWARDGEWADPSLAGVLEGTELPRRLRDRRRAVEELLAVAAGPVVQNATRGRFLSRNAERHADFLRDWGAIYERFGVPPEIGLAQAIVESGLNGRARSRVRALGFCQWLPRNWNRLKRLSPYVIEGYNQTTQAPFCAAYLTILTTMYDSFIPALSEHHAGGVNVGRTVVNGQRLGGQIPREQYLLGSDFARALRDISVRRYRALYRTYGRRSALYAEMVFGNMYNVRELTRETPQSDIYAMRVPRNTSLSTVVEQTGLSRNEVKRYNPALVRRVRPVSATTRRWYGADGRGAVPACPYGRAGRGRVVLAPAAERRVRRHARRLRQPGRHGGRVARAGLRGDAAAVPGAVCGDRHGGGHRDGHHACLRHRRPQPQPPRGHPRRVPHQRPRAGAVRARAAGARGAGRELARRTTHG